MTFGSLFSGIGGIDLGLERAGMQCVFQVEIDEHCRHVLAKHWPNVRRHDDVRTFPPSCGICFRRERDEDSGTAESAGCDCTARDWAVDLIAGGFPCQDISKAGYVQGKREGINGKRSGLWSEFVRIIRILRPRFILVENVAKIAVHGLGRVLGDLASLGFDAEWHCLPAASFGAPHIRDRMFVFAYPLGQQFRLPRRAAFIGAPPSVQAEAQKWDRLWTYPFVVGPLDGMAGDGADGFWKFEPGMVRVADGVSSQMDRLRGLGNAVVPQVAEWIGRQILAGGKGYAR